MKCLYMYMKVFLNCCEFNLTAHVFFRLKLVSLSETVKEKKSDLDGNFVNAAPC